MSDARLSDQEIKNFLAELPGWELSTNQLHTSFRFRDFSQALAFMVRTGLECEKLNHHPNWYNVYGRVDVQLWTHSESGVTPLDVRLAQLMSKIAQEMGTSAERSAKS